MAKKYLVTLTDAELDQLRELIRKGNAPARKLTRARILLLAHQGDTDDQIAHALQVGTATVERIRKRFVEESFQAALHERPRPGGRRKLNGKQEAAIIAMACTPPPEGRAKWTLQLLADRVVELKIVDEISDETIRRVLKKTS